MNRTLAACLVFATASISSACTTESGDAAPEESSTSQHIDWQWPPHAASGGDKPWHGTIPIANGDAWNAATGHVTRYMQPGLIWSSATSASYGPAGYGMELAAVERLSIAGATVSWHRPGGERIDFVANGFGGFSAPPETTAIMTQPAWNLYRLRMGGGTYMDFTQPNGAGWLLVRIFDRNGNTMTLSYDGADRLTQIT
ncbi:MAG TPA: RHS repeat domain-containing protein, partial [Kofleriaceae bacterium]